MTGELGSSRQEAVDGKFREITVVQEKSRAQILKQNSFEWNRDIWGTRHACRGGPWARRVGAVPRAEVGTVLGGGQESDTRWSVSGTCLATGEKGQKRGVLQERERGLHKEWTDLTCGSRLWPGCVITP